MSFSKQISSIWLNSAGFRREMNPVTAVSKKFNQYLDLEGYTYSELCCVPV